MERIVIVGYRPFPGKNTELKELMKTHLQVLRKENLVTDRQSVIMEAKDGTIIEVFGWKSKEAMNAAHTNQEVLKIWNAYEKVCEYIPISELPECQELFSEFSPVNF